MSGRRTIFGSQAGARTALYMAALVATRFNPEIKAFYMPLLAAGKAKKGAGCLFADYPEYNVLRTSKGRLLC